MRKVLATLALALVPAYANTVLTENFDSLASMVSNGWLVVNHSQPVGGTSWYQGDGGIFPAHDGAANSFVMADFMNTGATGTISTWLITPEIPLDVDVLVSFYSRQLANNWADRMQVRMSTAGSSADVGATSADTGVFTELLLDINAAQTASGYPATWTRFEVNTGAHSFGTTGRLAFRYYLTGAGSCTSCTGYYMGVDSLDVSTPEPATIGLTAAGILLVGLRLRKRQA
jgi:hypothetical protein